jgi:hypothetical protein
MTTATEKRVFALKDQPGEARLSAGDTIVYTVDDCSLRFRRPDLAPYDVELPGEAWCLNGVSLSFKTHNRRPIEDQQQQFEVLVALIAGLSGLTYTIKFDVFSWSATLRSLPEKPPEGPKPALTTELSILWYEGYRTSLHPGDEMVVNGDRLFLRREPLRLQLGQYRKRFVRMGYVNAEVVHLLAAFLGATYNLTYRIIREVQRRQFWVIQFKKQE